MTKHMEIKHKVKSINSKSTFNEIIEEAIISDTEKQMMKMHYLQGKDFEYIADELGYSLQGITKMHKRVLKKIESLL